MARQKPEGRGDSTAIHHARWLSRRKSITSVGPTVRLASRSLFHYTPAPALLASSLFIYMRPRRPLCRWKSTLGCHAADPAYYCITAPGGRASDEWRQIAGGTCWINLLSISSVTSPRHSCSTSSRIVAIRRQPTMPSSSFFLGPCTVHVHYTIQYTSF